MAWFDIINRSNGFYFAQEAMANWAFAPIVETHRGGFRFDPNGGLYFDPHFFTIQISNVSNFPQLFFKFSGNNFTFKNDITSNGIGTYIAAGSVVTTIELIDASGTVYNRLTGLNLPIPTDFIDVGQEPVNVFATSWRELSIPSLETLFAGNDAIDGSSGPETLYGYGGGDTLQGGAGSDTLYGGTGNDTLIGGGDADFIHGEQGDDTIVGYTAGDTIDGGADFDTWSLSGIRSTGISVGVTIDMRSASTLNMERLKLDGGNFRFTELQIGAASSINALQGTVGVRDVLDITASTYGTANGVVINLSTLVVTDWNTLFASDEYDRISISGSEGNDTIDGTGVRETIYGGGGDDLIRAGIGDDRIFGGTGNDTIRGGDWGDTIYAGDGNDIIIADDDRSINPNAQPGDDTVYGETGDDFIMVLGGFNNVDGGDGSDTISYDFTIDNQSSAGPLPVYVSIDLSRAVDINDPEGAFTTYVDVDFGEVYIPRGRDKLVNIENIVGSIFNDTIRGNAVGNRLDGQVGNDNLQGLGGNDTLIGGAGNDVLDGGADADRMEGGADNDIYGVDNAGDLVVELAGAGVDRVNSVINHTLGANVENLYLYGIAIMGRGNALANVILGNGQNNALYGEAGRDALSGGTGNDYLRGGLDADTLAGGAGADGFVFDTALGRGNIDTITDFNAADDQIWLDDVIFSGLARGTLAANLFKTIGAGGTLDADDRVAYDISNGRLYFDQNGAAGGGWVQFATLATKPAITAADFMVF